VIDKSAGDVSHNVCFHERKAVGAHSRGATPLNFGGTAFMIVARKVLECHQGPQRRKSVQKQVSCAYLAP